MSATKKQKAENIIFQLRALSGFVQQQVVALIQSNRDFSGKLVGMMLLGVHMFHISKVTASLSLWGRFLFKRRWFYDVKANLQAAMQTVPQAELKSFFQSFDGVGSLDKRPALQYWRYLSHRLFTLQQNLKTIPQLHKQAISMIKDRLVGYNLLSLLQHRGSGFAQGNWQRQLPRFSEHWQQASAPYLADQELDRNDRAILALAHTYGLPETTLKQRFACLIQMALREQMVVSWRQAGYPSALGRITGYLVASGDREVISQWQGMVAAVRRIDATHWSRVALDHGMDVSVTDVKVATTLSDLFADYWQEANPGASAQLAAIAQVIQAQNDLKEARLRAGQTVSDGRYNLDSSYVLEQKCRFYDGLSQMHPDGLNSLVHDLTSANVSQASADRMANYCGLLRASVDIFSNLGFEVAYEGEEEKDDEEVDDRPKDIADYRAKAAKVARTLTRSIPLFDMLYAPDGQDISLGLLHMMSEGRGVLVRQQKKAKTTLGRLWQKVSGSKATLGWQGIPRDVARHIATFLRPTKEVKPDSYGKMGRKQEPEGVRGVFEKEKPSKPGKKQTGFKRYYKKLLSVLGRGAKFRDYLIKLGREKLCTPKGLPSQMLLHISGWGEEARSCLFVGTLLLCIYLFFEFPMALIMIPVLVIVLTLFLVIKNWVDHGCQTVPKAQANNLSANVLRMKSAASLKAAENKVVGLVNEHQHCRELLKTEADPEDAAPKMA